MTSLDQRPKDTDPTDLLNGIDYHDEPISVNPLTGSRPIMLKQDYVNLINNKSIYQSNTDDCDNWCLLSLLSAELWTMFLIIVLIIAIICIICRTEEEIVMGPRIRYI